MSKEKLDLSDPSFLQPKKRAKSGYVALKRCAEGDVRVEIGEDVPSSFSQEAIDILLKKEAIKAAED